MITIQYLIIIMNPEGNHILIIGLYKMVENHQQEQDDANDVTEHGQLNV